MKPGVGQPCGDTDEILLGDADVDQTVGKLLTEGNQVARSHRVVAHRHDPVVGARESGELVGEVDATVERRGVDLRQCGHAESSSSAAVTCSGEGTLWCHSTRSSMKETPRPLIVSAMIATGLPVVEGPSASVSAA